MSDNHPRRRPSIRNNPWSVHLILPYLIVQVLFFLVWVFTQVFYVLSSKVFDEVPSNLLPCFLTIPLGTIFLGLSVYHLRLHRRSDPQFSMLIVGMFSVVATAAWAVLGYVEATVHDGPPTDSDNMAYWSMITFMSMSFYYLFWNILALIGFGVAECFSIRRTQEARYHPLQPV